MVVFEAETPPQNGTLCKLDVAGRFLVSAQDRILSSSDCLGLPAWRKEPLSQSNPFGLSHTTDTGGPDEGTVESLPAS